MLSRIFSVTCRFSDRESSYSVRRESRVWVLDYISDFKLSPRCLKDSNMRSSLS